MCCQSRNPRSDLKCSFIEISECHAYCWECTTSIILFLQDNQPVRPASTPPLQQSPRAPEAFLSTSINAAKINVCNRILRSLLSLFPRGTLVCYLSYNQAGGAVGDEHACPQHGRPGFSEGLQVRQCQRTADSEPPAKRLSSEAEDQSLYKEISLGCVMLGGVAVGGVYQ